MTDTTPGITTAYLAQLDAELAQLPADLHRDIVTGVTEELRGLDAGAAAARIRQLGDPAFIAAEARAETANGVPLVSQDAPPPGRTFSIVAAVVLIAGSLLVPVVGALAGLVFVSQAQAWTRREKAAAWLASAGVALLAVAAATVMASAGLGGTHLVVLVGYLVFPVVGIVLAVRARRRGWRASAPAPHLTERPLPVAPVGRSLPAAGKTLVEQRRQPFEVTAHEAGIGLDVRFRHAVTAEEGEHGLASLVVGHDAERVVHDRSVRQDHVVIEDAQFHRPGERDLDDPHG